MQRHSANLTWQLGAVDRQQREQLNGHRSCLLWFTGLSGAGKSTLAHRVEELLFWRGCRAYVLDGDNVRHHLCEDLGFGAEDRRENIRRVTELCRLMVDAGTITLTAFISPFRRDRIAARARMDPGDFIEVFCDTPLSVCEQRDTKGLYRRARAGEIKDFTGISSPYEPPEHPEIVVQTARNNIDECAETIMRHLVAHGKIPPRPLMRVVERT